MAKSCKSWREDILHSLWDGCKQIKQWKYILVAKKITFAYCTYKPNVLRLIRYGDILPQ